MNHPFLHIDHLEFLMGLGVAALLGALIGLERQLRQRTAGLRTNALVATGSSLFVLLSQLIPGVGDQSRVASYVVSGVGFLGAGVIMKDGGSIRGINTAATLWCSSAVGALAGFGLYMEAACGAAVVLTIHLALRPLAHLVNQMSIGGAEVEVHYKLMITCTDEIESSVRSLIFNAMSANKLVLHSIQSRDLPSLPHRVEVTAELESFSKQDFFMEQVVAQISLERGVTSAAWKMERI